MDGKPCTYLAFLGGDSGISGNQFCEDSTQSFNTQRQWCHIQQQHILDIPRENTSLDSGTYSNSLIWINSLAGRSAKDFLYSGLHLLRSHSMLISWCTYKIISNDCEFQFKQQSTCRNVLCTLHVGLTSTFQYNISFLQ